MAAYNYERGVRRMLLRRSTHAGTDRLNFGVQLSLGGCVLGNFEGVGEHHWQTARRGFSFGGILDSHKT